MWAFAVRTLELPSTRRDKSCCYLTLCRKCDHGAYLGRCTDAFAAPLCVSRHEGSRSMLGTVYVDFDGTIAPADPTDALFERFCDPSWCEIEQEWQEGRCTSQVCMAKQVDLLRATPGAIDNMIANVEIDGAFLDFVDLCQRWGLRVLVVSDGLDRVVGGVLKRAGLDLTFFANRLEWQGSDRWKLAFPYARNGCTASLGNCKCSHRASGWQRGRTSRSAMADRIFASPRDRSWCWPRSGLLHTAGPRIFRTGRSTVSAMRRPS